MAPITSTSDTGSNDGSETATLMGLPKELRDAIWEFALTEDEPVLPYLERRTIPRPDRKAYQTSIVRQMRRQPPSPALFHVDKRTRREAYPIYWRSNVFAFTLSDAWKETANKDQVDRWQGYVIPTGFQLSFIPGQPGFDTRPQMEVLWTVRLEFMMHEPDLSLEYTRPDRMRRWYMNAEHTPEGVSRPASIDVRLVGPDQRRKHFQLVFGGVLANSCTCLIRAEAEKRVARGGYHETTIAYFASQVEKQWREVWIFSSSHNEGSIAWVCKACGKLEVSRRGLKPWASGQVVPGTLPE
ncbi:hypothetical protein LTR15_006006 [Elasticomyces elasticus]|nr:hypothetical protein LTR15_006006 [Elasticomyces elasticus]